LAKCTEPEFRAALGRLDAGQACFCLVDECDAKPQEPWPYEVLLPYLDAAVERGARFVFVLAGSSGASLDDIKQRIAARPKGTDLLSRIPTGHEHVIAPMSLGDRLLIVLSQLRQAGAEAGRDIRAIEKLGLYYAALNPRLANARQLREFAVRAVERVPKTDHRVKYDHLFVPGDPENKSFWAQASPVAERLVNSFVVLAGDSVGASRTVVSVRSSPESVVTSHSVVTAEAPARTNLPRQLTSFIGREREIEEVKRLLPSTTLLTLHGPGGSGKTRLALRVAADLVDQYPDGVWVAELAALSDPGLVPKTVATALDIPEQPGRLLTDTLKDSLRRKTLLLVLDNCEHLVSACAELADALLKACPRVGILTTSHEPLGIPGEIVWDVPSLPVPESLRVTSLEHLGRFDGIRLFVDRAATAKPGFALTASNAAAIAQVCSRLDGIPLAIELAAARVRVLTTEQIAARLDDRFRLLTGGGRTALPRHQALRATMDWSHGLLSGQEQTVLRRLSVFAGGWTLDAAETVCAGDDVAAAEILDVLTRLVDKSLVLVETQEGEARQRFLETVREYCRERLAEAGESDRLRTEHVRFFLAFALRAHDALTGPNRLVWLRRTEVEHDNIRSALRWSITTKEFEEAFRLGAAMARFWARRGFLEEGLRWLGELRLHETCVSERARGSAWLGLGLLAFEVGDHKQAMMAEQALEVYRRVGDAVQVENCLSLLGMTENERGRFDRASALLDEAVTLARTAGSTTQEAERLRQRGYIEVRRGDYKAALGYLDRSLELLRGSGARRSIGFGLGHLAQTHLYQGEVDRAIVGLRDAIALVEAEEHSTAIAYFRNLLGLALLRKRDYEAAHRVYRDNLQYSTEIGHWWAAAQALIGIADIGTTKSVLHHAARLLAAADTFLKATDYQLPLAEALYLRALVDRARLGEAGFAAAWAEGRSMRLEQAIEYALAPEGQTDGKAPTVER
jgi:predicted ATPase